MRPSGRYWLRATFWDAVAAIATVGLCFLAGMAWHESRRASDAMEKQLKAMNDQLEVMQIEQRPWVAGPTSIKADEAPDHSVRFTQVFKNVGRAPTKAMFVDATIKRNWIYSFDGLTQVCGRPDKEVGAPGHNKFSLIPGSDWPVDPANVPGLRALPPNSFNSEEFQKAEHDILGCVAYLSPFDEVVHHTAYYAGIKKVKGQPINFPYIYAVDAK
jgi:hypothetical protein